MTQFKLNRFAVLVKEEDGLPREYEVTCYHIDTLRAEREAPKYGLNIKVAKGKDGEADVSNVLGQNLLTAEVWSAMRRERFYLKELGDFLFNDCLGVESLEDVVLDPTQPPTAPPSSSGTTGLHSASGSTPTDPAETTA